MSRHCLSASFLVSDESQTLCERAFPRWQARIFENYTTVNRANGSKISEIFTTRYQDDLSSSEFPRHVSLKGIAEERDIEYVIAQWPIIRWHDKYTGGNIFALSLRLYGKRDEHANYNGRMSNVYGMARPLCSRISRVKDTGREIAKSMTRVNCREEHFCNIVVRFA